MIYVNASVKSIARAKCYSWNPSICICENGKYLKSIADSLVIECDEIINAIDSVPTNVTNTISTNITKYYINKYYE